MAITPDQLLEAVRGKSLRSMRHICFETSRDLKPEDALKLAKSLLANPDVHGAMAATLIAGHVSYILPDALKFLRTECALHTDVRVQECLARAFDHYCLNKGDKAMAVMDDWSKDPNENVRRAAIEAPRPWHKKDVYRNKIGDAIRFIGALKSDASGNVRFSVGRALAEISEEFPSEVMAELKG